MMTSADPLAPSTAGRLAYWAAIVTGGLLEDPMEITTGTALPALPAAG
jgi:hypothetical protein